jgi:hypothetical protein
MQNITSISELKNAIRLLESEQEIKGKVLKEHFLIVYESFKPVNLITSTLNDISKSPFLIDNLAGTAIGLFSGFLTKKIFIGSSGNLVRKMIGSILQFGVTNVVAQHSDTIKSLGQILVRHFLHRNEMNSRSRD